MIDACENKANLTTRKPYTSDYDYEEDSDLEEDDDNNFSDDELSVVPPTIATEQSRNDLSTVVAIEHSDAKCNEPLDIISVSDLYSSSSESLDTRDEVNPVHFGKVVVIDDVAFVT